MSTLQWALRSIGDAPRGPQVGAFFDLDGSLVEGFTAMHFLRDQIRRGEISATDVVELATSAWRFRDDPTAGVDLIRGAVAKLRGEPLESMQARAARVFKKKVGRSIRSEARQLVRAHREAGHTLVLATAATQFQAGPVAADLGIENILSTRVAVEDGVLTGELLGRPRWGSEKAKAVADFAATNGIALEESFGYGNGTEDYDFLKKVGRPVAVSPDPGLLKLIDGENIPILPLADPPRPGVRGFVGTLGAFSTFNVGLLLTLLATALVDRRKAFAFGVGRTADVTLAAAGIRVRAQGLEHIEAARPAVFVFNHQSNLDPAVVVSLIRRDITGVGKAELKSDPRGIMLRLMDITLIDRGNSDEARASVAALVSRIHGGESVLIAPEGTRMPTPSLGPFKMGAFHLALDARVPVVPIVIRNSGEHWPRGASLIRPGLVDVCVLPPVPTKTWTREGLKDHVSDIRAAFAQTLERWPSTEPAAARS